MKVHRTEPRATGANVDFAVCALLSLPPPPITAAFKFELWVELAGVETLVATALCGAGELALCSAPSTVVQTSSGGYPLMLSGTLDGTADSKLVLHAKPSTRMQPFSGFTTTCWMGQTYRLDTGASTTIPPSSAAASSAVTVPVRMEAQEELSESSLAFLLPAQFLALRVDDLQVQCACVRACTFIQCNHFLSLNRIPFSTCSHISIELHTRIS